MGFLLYYSSGSCIKIKYLHIKHCRNCCSGPIKYYSTYVMYIILRRKLEEAKKEKKERKKRKERKKEGKEKNKVLEVYRLKFNWKMGMKLGSCFLRPAAKFFIHSKLRMRKYIMYKGGRGDIYIYTCTIIHTK